MWFPFVLGIFALVLAAIVFVGGYAEERRSSGPDDLAAATTA
jgi:hypothetical protein